MTIYLLIFFVIFVAGLVLLSLSAELLVRGASRLATALGVSPFLVGATIVAYGTSLPEFVVSVFASLLGASPIALGNVIGSNLFNTSLILGVAVLISPMVIEPDLVGKLKRIEIPFNVLLTLLVAVMSLGMVIGQGKGLALLVVFCVYIILALRMELGERKMRNQGAPQIEKGLSTRTVLAFVGAILFSLMGLVVSAWFMVESAIMIARILDVSERIIGLTIVAFGTSLPELAAAISAARKGHTDMILGNLLGSNLFNLALILGAAAAIRPIFLDPKGQLLDFGFLLVNTGLVTLFILSGKRLGRMEGVSLVAFYALFALMLAIF